MKLWEAAGKTVRVTFRDGDEMTGFVNCYTSALDNEPDPESIMIGNIELYAPEIKSIELY